MIETQALKIMSVTPPAAIVDNASFTTAEIDTLGWDYATFIFYLGATDIAFTAMKVQESDTTGSGMADVPGAVFGTSLNDAGATSTLPSATDDNKIFAISLDLTKRKRFLDPVVTIGDGTVGGFCAALCILSRGEQGPNTAVESGFSQRLIV